MTLALRTGCSLRTAQASGTRIAMRTGIALRTGLTLRTGAIVGVCRTRAVAGMSRTASPAVTVTLAIAARTTGCGAVPASPRSRSAGSAAGEAPCSKLGATSAVSGDLDRLRSAFDALD